MQRTDDRGALLDSVSSGEVRASTSTFLFGVVIALVLCFPNSYHWIWPVGMHAGAALLCAMLAVIMLRRTRSHSRVTWMAMPMLGVLFGIVCYWFVIGLALGNFCVNGDREKCGVLRSLPVTRAVVGRVFWLWGVNLDRDVM